MIYDRGRQHYLARFETARAAARAWDAAAVARRGPPTTEKCMNE